MTDMLENSIKDALHFLTHPDWDDERKRKTLQVNMEYFHPNIIQVFETSGLWIAEEQKISRDQDLNSIVQALENIRSQMPSEFRTDGEQEPEPESAINRQEISMEDTVREVASAWRNAQLQEICNLERFLMHACSTILRSKGSIINPNNIPEQLAGGRTQVGKTGFKALLALLAFRLQVLTVVITTTIGLREQLVNSLQNVYFNSIPEDQRPQVMSINKPKGFDASQYDSNLTKCLAQHGVVVVNCTKYSIDKVYRRIAMLRGTRDCFDFLLVRDESDIMDRTPARMLQLEKALDRLTGRIEDDGGGRLRCPLMILHVSATLVPLFLRLLRGGGGDLVDEERPTEAGGSVAVGRVQTDMANVDPDVYCGLECMEPIGGRFLIERELRCGNKPLPYWSDTVEALYRDAHPLDQTQQKRGVLLLDAVNPRVYAAYNIRDRASWVQRHFPRFVVVLASGAGISLRFPHMPWMSGEQLDKFVWSLLHNDDHDRLGRRGFLRLDAEVREEEEEERQEGDEEPAVRPRASMSDVLTAIVCAWGMENPVAVFGYTRMLRGESYRSSPVWMFGNASEGSASSTPVSLVPTHMLCGLGERQSFENLVQMLGRGTGNFKRDLQHNGHDKLKLATTWKDYDAAMSYLSFQSELAERVERDGIEAAIGALAAPYGTESNFVGNGSRRTVGPSKLLYHLPVKFQGKEDGLGRKWAESQGMPRYGCGNLLYRLDTPLPEAVRAGLTDEFREAEDFLYHSQHNSKPGVLVLRRAVCELPADQVWQSEAYWSRLYREALVLSVDRKGSCSVVLNKKTFDVEKARKAVEPFRLLQNREVPGCAEGRLEFSILDHVVRFMDQYREWVDKQMPVWTEEQLRKCADKADPHQSEPMVGCAKSSDTEESEGVRGFSNDDMYILLNKVWTMEDLRAAMRRYSLLTETRIRDISTLKIKSAMLKGFCKARPQGCSSAESMLLWLVEKDMLTLDHVRKVHSPQDLRKLFPHIETPSRPSQSQSSSARNCVEWILRSVERDRDAVRRSLARTEAADLDLSSVIPVGVKRQRRGTVRLGTTAGPAGSYREVQHSTPSAGERQSITREVDHTTETDSEESAWSRVASPTSTPQAISACESSPTDSMQGSIASCDDEEELDDVLVLRRCRSVRKRLLLDD